MYYTSVRQSSRQIHYRMIETEKIVIGLTSFLITLTFFISTFGNGAILFVFAKDKKLRNSSTIFITNLAAVGVLQGAVLFPLLQIEMIVGKQIIGSSRIACLAREFLNEFITCANFYSLFLVALNRYCVVLLKHRYKRYFSPKKSAILIVVAWFISASYAAATSYIQVTSLKLQDFKCHSSLWYPRSMASLQFATYGVPFTLILSINVLLLIYFIQDKNGLPLPATFYSEGSMERRMAPGRKRRLTKNIRVLALTIVSFSSCHMVYFGCILLAMFTGKFVRLAYVTSVSLVCFGCIVHPYLYGYLNKRLKRPLRRILRRMRLFICRRKNNEALVAQVSSCSFTSSKISTLSRTTEGSFIDDELTRSKISNLN